MAKLDKQNRLIVPKSLIEISDTDFSGDVRLFFRGKELFFANPSQESSKRNCLGKIQFDDKRRFFVPKLARELLNLKPNDNLSFYVQDGKVIFRKVFFIPENR